MVSRRLWFPEEELKADRVAQAQKMLGDAFKGVKDAAGTAQKTVQQQFEEDRVGWAQKQMEQAFSGLRQAPQPQPMPEPEPEPEPTPPPAPTPSPLAPEATQPAASMSTSVEPMGTQGLGQVHAGPTPGVDIPEDAPLTPGRPTDGAMGALGGMKDRLGQAKDLLGETFKGIRDTAGNLGEARDDLMQRPATDAGAPFDALGTKANDLGFRAPGTDSKGILGNTGLGQGVRAADQWSQDVMPTPKSLAAPTGLLGEQGPLMKSLDPDVGNDPNLAGLKLGLESSGYPAQAKGAVRTGRDWMQSLDAIGTGADKLTGADSSLQERGQGAAEAGMGVIGAMAPQFTYIGNVAAERAKELGYDDDKAETIGAVVGFLTPGGGAEQLGKAGAYAKRTQDAGSRIGRLGGMAEDFARTTGNIGESAEDLAKLGRFRSLAPAAAMGVAAPIGGVMGARSAAQKEGATAEDIALGGIGGAFKAADIVGGVSEMGIGAGAKGLGALRNLPGTARRVRDALGEGANPVSNLIAYHGTADTYKRPRPGGGIFGDAHYVSDRPETAEMFAADRSESPFASASYDLKNYQDELANLAKRTDLSPGDRLQEEEWLRESISEAQKMVDRGHAGDPRAIGPGAPQIRPTDVPDDMRFFDLNTPLDKGEASNLLAIMAGGTGRKRGAVDPRVLDMLDDFKTKADFYEALTYGGGDKTHDLANKVNRALRQVGYEGVKYQGERSAQIPDNKGGFLPYTEYAIFPDSMSKIRNALTGKPFGITRDGSTSVDGKPRITRGLKLDAAGELLGGVAGAQMAGQQFTDEEDSPLKKGLVGAAGFAMGSQAGGQLRKNAGTLQRVAKAFQSGEAPSGAPRGRVIPADVARNLNLPQQVGELTYNTGFMPNRMDIANTIRNTKGARLFPDGTLEMDLERAGKKKRELFPTGRGGVYYYGREGGAKEGGYVNNSANAAEGGNVFYPPRKSAFRNVLFVDETGSMGRDASSALLGKDRFEREEKLIGRLFDARDQEGLLQKYQEMGWSAEEAPRIIAAIFDQKDRNRTLSYIIPESMASGLARKAGYEAVVGIERLQADAPRVGEVYDLREGVYPAESGEYGLHPDFAGEARQVGGKVVDPVLREIAQAEKEGRIPKGLDNPEGMENRYSQSNREMLRHLGITEEDYREMPQDAKLRLDDYLFNPKSGDRSRQLGDMVEEALRATGEKTQRWSSPKASENWGTGKPVTDTSNYKAEKNKPNGGETYLGKILQPGETPPAGMVSYDPATQKYIATGPGGEAKSSNSYVAAELNLNKMNGGLPPEPVKSAEFQQQVVGLKSQPPSMKSDQDLEDQVAYALGKGPAPSAQPLKPPEEIVSVTNLAHYQEVKDFYPVGTIFKNEANGLHLIYNPKFPDTAESAFGLDAAKGKAMMVMEENPDANKLNPGLTGETEAPKGWSSTDVDVTSTPKKLPLSQQGDTTDIPDHPYWQEQLSKGVAPNEVKTMIAEGMPSYGSQYLGQVIQKGEQAGYLPGEVDYNANTHMYYVVNPDTGDVDEFSHYYAAVSALQKHAETNPDIKAEMDSLVNGFKDTDGGVWDNQEAALDKLHKDHKSLHDTVEAVYDDEKPFISAPANKTIDDYTNDELQGIPNAQLWMEDLVNGTHPNTIKQQIGDNLPQQDHEYLGDIIQKGEPSGGYGLGAVSYDGNHNLYYVVNPEDLEAVPFRTYQEGVEQLDTWASEDYDLKEKMNAQFNAWNKMTEEQISAKADAIGEVSESTYSGWDGEAQSANEGMGGAGLDVVPDYMETPPEMPPTPKGEGEWVTGEIKANEPIGDGDTLKPGDIFVVWNDDKVENTEYLAKTKDGVLHMEPTYEKVLAHLWDTETTPQAIKAQQPNAPEPDEMPYLHKYIDISTPEEVPGDHNPNVGTVAYDVENQQYQIINVKTGEIENHPTYTEAEKALLSSIADTDAAGEAHDQYAKWKQQQYDKSTPEGKAALQAASDASVAEVKAAPSLGQKIKAGIKAILAPDENGILGARKKVGSEETPKAPRQTKAEIAAEQKRLRDEARSRPSAADARLGRREDIPPGPTPSEAGALQTPRVGEDADVDRRVQGTHIGGPMGAKKQVAEETPGDLTWKKGDPVPTADDLEASGQTPTGQQAYDMASALAEETRLLEQIVKAAGANNPKMLEAGMRIIGQQKARNGEEAGRLRKMAEAKGGEAARVSKVEANRISRLKATQEARAKADAETLGINPDGTSTAEDAPDSTDVEGTAAKAGGSVQQTEAGPRAVDPEGRVINAKTPAEVDLDGKPTTTTPPPARARTRGATTTTTTPATPGVPAVTVSTTGATGSGQGRGKGPGQGQGQGRGKGPGTGTPKAPRPPKVAPPPQPQMADTGWLDARGRLKRLSELEGGVRQQLQDEFTEWTDYRTNLKGAGSEAEKVKLTSDYEAAVRKRSASKAQALSKLSIAEITQLASHSGPQGKDIRDLIKRANANEEIGANPEFITRDFITNYARVNLIGANPMTIARNAMGGAANAIWHPIEAAMASALDPAISYVYQKRGLTEKLERRYGKEGLYVIDGYLRSLPAAMINAREAMRQGQRYTAQGLKEGLESEKNRTVATRAIGKLADRLMTPLTATDAIFRTMTQGGELMRQSYRQMKDVGMSQAEIDSQMVKLLQGPRSGYVTKFGELAAKDLATGVQKQMNYRAFTQELDDIGRQLQKVQQVPGGSLILPFITTPYNSAKFDIERSPAAALRNIHDMTKVLQAKDVDKIITSGEMADRVGRTMVGSAMMAGMTWAAISGVIDLNGSLPDSQGERDAWEREGRRPYSIKLPGSDRYTSFQDIPGLNATLVQVAVAKDILNTYGSEDRRYDAAVVRGILEATRTLAAQPMAGGVLEAAQAMGQPSRQANWKMGFAGPLLPLSGVARTYTAAKDAMQREQPKNITDALARVYHPEALPVRHDAFGGRMENWNAGVPGMINPIRTNAATGFRAPTKYYGSRNASTDVEITRSADKVREWENDPRKPRPTGLDFARAARAEATNPVTEMRRSDERARLERENQRRSRPSPLEELLTSPPRR